MSYPFTMTNDTITVIVDGQPHNVKKGAQHYDAVKKAVLSEDWKQVKELVAPGIKIEEWALGAFKYSNGTITVAEGEEVPSQLYQRILAMVRERKSPKSLINFWERLKKNPSKRSVDMLFEFLQHVHIPIDEEGFVLAYKGVRNDYKDAHSGTFTNTPGSRMKMARNKISDDPRTPCAEGFHVGALSYAKSFSQRTVICKVDPADVVCVPYDSNQQKVRVCEYLVVGNYVEGAPLPSTVVDKHDIPVDDDTSDEVDPDDDSEEIDNEDDAPAEDEPAEDEDLSEDAPAEDDDSEEVVVQRSNTTTMDRATLEGMKLDEVREFAKTQGVKNVKAVAGGKPALIDLLLSGSPAKKPEEVKKSISKEVKKDEFQVKTGKVPTGTKTLKDLEKLNIGDLRKYASGVLKIVGASKLPGGKTALLAAIKAQGVK